MNARLSFAGGDVELKEPTRADLLQSAKDWALLVEAETEVIRADLAAGEVYRLPIMSLCSAVDRLENALTELADFDAKHDPDAAVNAWEERNGGMQ